MINLIKYVCICLAISVLSCDAGEKCKRERKSRKERNCCGVSTEDLINLKNIMKDLSDEVRSLKTRIPRACPSNPTGNSLIN